MDRSNHYEAAFEAYLQWHRLCYVAVDETALHAQVYLWLKKPGIHAVNEVVKALEAITHVDRDLQAPAWLSPKHPTGPAADYVACRNGLLSLSTGKLEPHTSKFLTMNALPCDFDPEAKAPRWEQFEEEVFARDREVV